jgi:hypothetical protein
VLRDSSARTVVFFNTDLSALANLASMANPSEDIMAKIIITEFVSLDGVSQDPQKWMRRTIGEARGAVDQCRACGARPGGGKVTNWLGANRELRDKAVDRMLSI